MKERLDVILVEQGYASSREKAKAIIMSGNAPKTMLRIMVSLYDNRFLNASYKLFKKFFQ